MMTRLKALISLKNEGDLIKAMKNYPLDIDYYPLFSGKHLKSFVLNTQKLLSFLENSVNYPLINAVEVKLQSLNRIVSLEFEVEIKQTTYILRWGKFSFMGNNLLEALRETLSEEKIRELVLKNLFDCQLNYPYYHWGSQTPKILPNFG